MAARVKIRPGYLRQSGTGRVYGYTRGLAKRDDMSPCDKDGNQVRTVFPPEATADMDKEDLLLYALKRFGVQVDKKLDKPRVLKAIRALERKGGAAPIAKEPIQPDHPLDIVDTPGKKIKPVRTDE